MRGRTGLRADDRAVSATVTHALALGISAILISGLLFTAGTLLEDQRENSAREQLRTVGNRIAEDLSRAGAMAQDGGNVTIQTRQPRSVAGRTYTVTFLTGSDCDTDLFDAEACLELELQDEQAVVMVPVRNETAVSFEPGAGGTFTISATANASAQPPTAPAIKRDLRVGIGDDIGEFASGQALNLTNQDPIAGFRFTPGQPSVSSVIHFENDTQDLDGVITKYEWDLNGDGTIDQTGREFNHSYSDPGKYTVTLTVTDDDGETDSVSKVISVGGLVYNAPTTANNVSGTSTDAALNFSLTNQHGADVEILELLIDPNDPGDDVDELDVSSPEAEIEIDGDVSGDAYTSSLTIYDDGRIVDLADDGTSAVLSAGSTPDVRFAGFKEAGAYTDMDGVPVFVSVRYVVNGTYYTSQFTLFGSPAGNVPPNPDFDYQCNDPPKCDFDDDSTDDDMPLQDWQWNFGDGDTSSFKDPGGHTFPANGSYDVSLTVTDSDGVSSTVTKTVLVGAAPPPVVFAVNAGGNELTADGVVYERDRESDPHPFHTGDDNEYTTTSSIDNTTNDELYQSAREADDGWGWFSSPGSFGYDVPVPNGEYQVTFRFAELNGWVNDGGRVFDVELENAPALTNVDVYDAVGTDDHSYDRSATVNVTDGELDIDFIPDSDPVPPMVNAIVVRQLDAVSYQEDQNTSERIVMEAENYDRQVPGNYQDASGDDMSGDSWVTIANASASGNTALEGQPNNGDSAGDTENGPRLDYYVEITNPDPAYYVWVRMYCPSVADDAVHVGVNGQPATYGGSGLNGNASTLCRDESGWMWASYAAGSQAQLDLSTPGQQTINVWMGDDGVRIDKIVVSTNAGAVDGSTGTGPPESPES